LQGALNWDLLHRQLYTANRRASGGFDPLPPVSLTTSANIIAAGAKNSQGYANWQLGAWLFPCLLVSPSSQSEFVALMQTSRIAVPLNRLALIQMPQYIPRPYLLYFQIPKWHQELLLEVWSYSGPESTTVEESLHRIETKIDALNS